MMLIPGLQSLSAVAFERLLSSLVEGSLLVMCVALAMRFVPRNSSRAKFAVWFSALVATALLPLLDLKLGGSAQAVSTHGAAITLPISAAMWVFAGWALLACLGMLRVMTAIWQVRRLRRSSLELSSEQLGPELAEIIDDFSKGRPVSVLVSNRVQVPTALGFFKSAVVLPEWMLKEAGGEELKHVVLHELAHLQRHDDWTNLVQKIVKALLFFHPAVWWMDRELSMQREMACDDTVLAQTASPRTYAECLARVAEKSFMRRQIALAQAAVTRMRQLSVRVGRILDPNRAQSTKSWKPAIPAVVALALISGVSVSSAPELVRVEDGGSSAKVSQASAVSSVDKPVAHSDLAVTARAPQVRAWPASMKFSPHKLTKSKSLYVPARQREQQRPIKPRMAQIKTRSPEAPPVVLARYGQKPGPRKIAPTVQQREFVLVIETRQMITAGAEGWQVQVQQLRWLVPVEKAQKSIPSKT
ncbi:MAG TPA: M56 family metallopeptidase [Candidatus Angelobacter sp.]|nr:M56 family metallopeptidase [Candidatus Angelobacter sp.]